MPFRAIFACFFLLVITGCATVPPADYSDLRAGDTGDAASHLDYLRKQSERIAGRNFVAGNRVALLQNGAEAYPAMRAAIRSARHRIDMESFIFDGQEGAQFAAALLKQRARGVEVNLIYDSFGSSEAPQALFDRLRAGGVRTVDYNPVDALSVVDTSIDHRDHRKLLLVDGKTAFVGGINITEVYRLKLGGRRYLIPHPEDLDPDTTPWRDVQVKIDGPVVGEFERLFMQTWREQQGPSIPDPWVSAQPRGSLLVEAVDETPDDHSYKIYRSLQAAIALARQSVHLTTGFFVPTPDLVRALEDAARRGVDVALILPSKSDSDLALHASHAYYQELMAAGVRIYERQGVILHAKTAVIDGAWSTVGSSNLDWRSAALNNECNAVILGPTFGQQMETVFQDDIAQSKRIDPQAWEDRPIGDVLDEEKARIFAYFL